MATERVPRRRFLKGLGAVAATATVGEQIALSSSAYADSPGEKNKGQKSSELHIFNVLGKDYDSTILAASQHWGVVWARIIALAWTEWNMANGFKTELVSKDPTRVRAAIRNRLNYELNNELELIIEADTTVKYSGPPTATTDLTNYDPWKDLPKHRLTMYLPQPPDHDEHRAIALAEYADSGRNYPFTSL